MQSPPPAVTLRRFDPEEDAGALMAWAADPLFTRFLRLDPFADLAAARRYIASYIVPHPWYRVICAGGAPVGYVAVHPAKDYDWEQDGAGPHKAYVGYGLARAHWGRGIAAEALRMVVGAGGIFDEMPSLKRLEAYVDVENPASARVAEKAGFKKEGLLRKNWMLRGVARDDFIFSYLDTDRPKSNDVAADCINPLP